MDLAIHSRQFSLPLLKRGYNKKSGYIRGNKILFFEFFVVPEDSKGREFLDGDVLLYNLIIIGVIEHTIRNAVVVGKGGNLFLIEYFFDNIFTIFH